MAKRPNPGRCVHCLADTVARTWDHVLPVSWYPEGTSPDLEKWKVPSCLPCNNALGKIESDLFILIAACLDPFSEGAKGLWDRAKRAMTPELARDEVDRRCREATRVRFISRVRPGASVPVDAIYPGMGPDHGKGYEGRIAFSIPEHLFSRVAEKIVRGIWYLETGGYIEPPHKAIFYAVREEGAMQIREVLEESGVNRERGPGLEINWVVDESDLTTALFQIRLWRRVESFVAILAGEP